MNKLLQKFYVVCNQQGISDENRKDIVAGYGYSSSREMKPRDLIDAINKLEGKNNSEADIWRKRVIAAIGAWLRSVGKEEHLDYIKSLSCRASGYEYFNKIPVSRLRDIYNEFKRKGKVVTETDELMFEVIEHLKSLN